MPLEMTRRQLDDMVAHARDEAPLECCGIIGGAGDRALATYRTRNIDQSRVHYTIHPEDHYRVTREIEDVREWDVLGFYHSHPASEAFPSSTDIRHALGSSRSRVVSPATTSDSHWLRPTASSPSGQVSNAR